MEIVKRQIKYSIENFISRLPGLFTYMEDGKIYMATTAHLGCYGKYVCDLRFDNDINVPKIQEDEYGNLIFIQQYVNGNMGHIISLPVWDEENYVLTAKLSDKNDFIYHSYRTIIGIYHKYKVVKGIINNKYFNEYFKDYKTNEDKKITYEKLQTIKQFLDFVDKGIGRYTVEELVEEYNESTEIKIEFNYVECTQIPSIIYLATAADLLNEMKILKSSCEFYEKITDEERKKEFNEFCCECQKFHLKGGDNMITLLEYCVQKAKETVEYYDSLSNKKIYFNIPVPLHLSMSEMGIYQQYSNVWDSTRGYKKGELVTYDNETYICVGTTDNDIVTDTDENNEPIYYGKYNEYDIIEFPYKTFKKIKDCTHYVSENTPYEEKNKFILKNVLGGNNFNIKDENGKDKEDYSITAKTSSRLSGLRRLKSFTENNIEVRPYGNEDWLFYYQKGVVSNKKITDKLANLIKIDNSGNIISNEKYFNASNDDKLAFQNNFYIYGDCIDEITCGEDKEEDKYYITFKYTINAHLRPTEFTRENDEAGNELLYYRNLEKDEDSINGKYHGISYTEQYYVTSDNSEGSLYQLIQGNEYFLIPSGTIILVNDEQSYTIDDFVQNDKVEENNAIGGFYKVYYTFEDYVNKRTVTLIHPSNSTVTCEVAISETKKYSFNTSSNFKSYDVDTTTGKTQINDVVSEYNVTIENKVDYEYNNLYKEDYLMGIHYQPYVEENVYIDRGNAHAYESYLKLMEVKTMQDLENYQNGGFFKIEKMT